MVFPPGPAPPWQSYRPWRLLGARITAARVARHWTMPQLAGLVLMGVTTVRLWETGQRRPRRHTLRRLASLLAIPYDELAALAGYPVEAG